MGIIVRCEDCGEKFDSCNLQKVCSQCIKTRDEILLVVQERIRQEPGIKARAICEELGLSERVTIYIIKKDREEADILREQSIRGMIKDSLRR